MWALRRASLRHRSPCTPAICVTGREIEGRGGRGEKKERGHVTQGFSSLPLLPSLSHHTLSYPPSPPSPSPAPLPPRFPELLFHQGNGRTRGSGLPRALPPDTSPRKARLTRHTHAPSRPLTPHSSLPLPFPPTPPHPSKASSYPVSYSHNTPLTPPHSLPHDPLPHPPPPPRITHTYLPTLPTSHVPHTLYSLTDN